MRGTSTDYRHPYRPAPLRVANRVGRALGARASLDPRALMAEARRRTGLGDFGDPSFHEPMGVLLRSIEREAGLTPIGRLITRERLIGVLANRLRIQEALRRWPEIGARPLRPPVVITGLQRTGTTLLHRLLATDPNRRWLASWEALHPAPVLEGEDRRIANAERAQKALRYMAPDFFAVHPVRARGPEEDVLLLDLAFRSTVPEATLRVPTYARWLEDQDQRPAYAYEALAMRMLSHQRNPEARWLLKTPHHLEWLDVLFEVLGDAKVVWTHRDPATTTASFCSMVAHGRGVFSDRVDPHEIGRDWGRKVVRLIERAMATRERARQDAFLDIRYDDLVRDPMGEVRRIYAFLGDELDEALADRMRATLEGHPQHAFGEHRYRLEDFGLNADEVRERFTAYRQRFAL